MNAAAWIERELAALREQQLDRRTRVLASTGPRVRVDGREAINLSSNDYLGLALDPRLDEAAARATAQYGNGATSSRLIVGTLPCHEELEQRLARFKGYASALLFGSGYLANIGAVPALAGRGDHVFADRLAHASLVDGARLSGARLHRFRHNDPEHLDVLLSKTPGRGRRVVLTESVFSMDGDLAPLPALAAAAAARGALLYVDEAHATGVFGPGGRGRVCAHGLEDEVAVSMGTLSKALGSYGGFVACPAVLREWLVNRARGFIYTTALPPAVVGASLGALDVLEAEPGRGAELLAAAAAFRGRLRAGGLDTGRSESPIIPLRVGDAGRALRFAARLREAGVLAVAIRPPTVPPGSARIRLAVTAAHRPEDLEEAAAVILDVAGREGLT